METTYRPLTTDETARLRQLGNSADDWTTVAVADPFCPECLQGNRFEGRVRLGAIGPNRVHDGSLALREGIYNSTLADVSIGNHPAIHDVRMLGGYTTGDNVLLFNIGEMTADAAGEHEVWIAAMNENGRRSLMPCGGMTVGDAYLWARYRGRHALMERLGQFSRRALAAPGGGYGHIGDAAVVKNTATLRNVDVRSRADDPTRIDSCTALVDGVVGYGCTLACGVIAKRFLLGEHVHLEDGLRLTDTVVGDNSTLARCEVGNSIIFPAHEQHHNNSFLIAALVMGQSNIAAGGTIGSNHNSRTADGELAAGRGFWPGLCCSLKHSSRFASHCLLAKGDYPAELDITLPFALVNNNVAEDRLEVMPAYWWMYNMYAMERNSRKFARRDTRVVKAQHIEFDNLAPDTAEEILRATTLLRRWHDKAGAGPVMAEDMEKSSRPTLVLKAAEGLEAYDEMLVYYAMNTLTAAYGTALPPTPPAASAEWVNIGGQLVAANDIEQMIADIENGTIDSWEEVNGRFDALWRQYPAQRLAHAYSVLCRLAGVTTIDDDLWQRYLARHSEIKDLVASRAEASRRKDDENPYRHTTSFDDEEWAAVMK